MVAVCVTSVCQYCTVHFALSKIISKVFSSLWNIFIVAERVMKGRHVLGGSELELKPYRPDKEKTPQVI